MVGLIAEVRQSIGAVNQTMEMELKSRVRRRQRQRGGKEAKAADRASCVCSGCCRVVRA